MLNHACPKVDNKAIEDAFGLGLVQMQYYMMNEPLARSDFALGLAEFCYIMLRKNDILQEYMYRERDRGRLYINETGFYIDSVAF